MSLDDKHRALRDCLRQLDSVLVAFSGGVDSTFLVKVAHETLGARAVAVTARSPTYPRAMAEQADALGKQVGIRHEWVDSEQMARPEFVGNPADRCYHCKSELFERLEPLRHALDLRWIAEGTNVDDLSDHRPGLAAARERGVQSPLVDAGLTKADIRALSRGLGLPTWDQPASPCLSSRFPTGVAITVDRLTQVDRAEAWLRAKGFRECRVRYHGEIARIEVGTDEMARLLDPVLRVEVTAALRALGFRYVALDLSGFRSGSLSRPDESAIPARMIPSP